MNFALGPDFEEETIPDAGEGEAGGEATPTPDERIAALEEALASERSLNKKQIDDLKRTVGRAQSLIDRSDRVTKADLETSLNKEFGSVQELLAAIVAQADPTVFPDALRVQVAKAAEEAAKRTERDSLRAEVLAELLPVVQQSSAEDANLRVQRQIETELTAAGFETDDLDWAEADKAWRQDGEGGVMKYARDSIAGLVSSRDADTSRQERKAAVTKTPAPAGATAAQAELAKYLDPKTPFAERMAIHKKMGL